MFVQCLKKAPIPLCFPLLPLSKGDLWFLLLSRERQDWLCALLLWCAWSGQTVEGVDSAFSFERFGLNL